MENGKISTIADVQAMVKETLGPVIGEIRAEILKVAQRQSDSMTPAALVEMFRKAGQVPGADKDPKAQGTQAAKWLRAMAAGKGDPERAAKIAKGWGDEALSKALGESTLAGGGALVPPQFATEVIDLLTARAVMRSLGATSVPMNNGSITIPFLSTGASAAYIGENANIGKTEQTFGQLQMMARKLTALIPISNDLLRDAGPQADVFVRNDLVRALQLREDIAFIRDDGSENKPKGMFYWSPAANRIAITHAGAVSTLDETTTDLVKIFEKLESGNIPMLKPGIIMTPRVKWFLMKLRDAQGNYAFAPEMRNGTLFGVPFRLTTQIPNTLGGPGDESELYLADFDSLVIAENMQLEVGVFEGGAYHDGSNVISGISQDQTVMRAIARHDFGCRYRGSEVAVLTGVDWAP